MKKINPSLPKGTRDFGPDDMRKREYLFNIFKDVFSLFGFNSIQTPAMENMEVLNGKYGDEGDKLIYRLLDSGNFIKKVEKIEYKDYISLRSKISKKGLRYDLTVPFARYVSMNRNKITLPFKRYQIQPVWRADKPQKGRFREFFQCDVDYIGTKSLVCEAEIIDLVYSLFNRINISDFEIKLNNRKILLGIAEILNFSENFEKFCILIDKIQKIGFEKFKIELKKNGFSSTSISELSKILSYKGDNNKKIEFLSKFLKNSKIGSDGINQIRDLIKVNNKFKIDFSLARGLSYYTSTIFEVIPTKEKIGSLCGGGRYDDLTEIFGYKDISGIGISFGIERIIEIMNVKKLFPNNILSSNNVLISYLSNEYMSKSLEIAKLFRKNNIKVDLYSDNGKLKKQLQYANNNNIPYVIIIGEEEIKSNLFTLKNMKDGSQKKLSIENILSKISS